MKKLCSMLAVLIACTISVNAQTAKGTLLLGGSAAFSSQSGMTTFVINPNIGGFVADKIAVGLDAAFATSSEDGSSANAWAIGPYVKPYFGTSPAGSFFAKGMVLFGGGTGSETSTGFGLALGYAKFLNQSVALEFSPAYSKIKDNPGVFSVNVGFQVHFKK